MNPDEAPAGWMGRRERGEMIVRGSRRSLGDIRSKAV
jgi:hypothetical protein